METAGTSGSGIQPGGAVVLAACSLPGSPGGYLFALSARDGSLLSRLELPAAPAFDGLAVAKGKVFISLQDGTVMCCQGSGR
ncbi:MAG: hypothetical protein WCI17_00275 [bacterium]